MNNRLRAPVRFSPSVEQLDADEAKTTQGLIATIRYITDKTFADGGHAIRGVHAKSHGILEGYLEGYADLPGDLAQGMFAKPGRYPVVIRLSTIPGDILDDSVSVPRAMAVKIIGIEGERLEGSENDVTQDFVMINGPAFGAPTPKKFLSVLRLLSKTTEKFEWLKKIDDGMSFSPWHGLAAHRPLGGIMRVRKAVYEMAKKFRAEKNRRVIEEPREMVSFKD